MDSYPSSLLTLSLVIRVYFLVVLISLTESLQRCDPQLQQYKITRNGTEIGWCLKCSECPKGEGALVKCGSTIDVKQPTRCDPCKAGVTFSGTSGFEQCQLCNSTTCLKNEVVIGKCDLYSDNTWCSGKCEKGYEMNKNKTECELIDGHEDKASPIPFGSPPTKEKPAITISVQHRRNLTTTRTGGQILTSSETLATKRKPKTTMSTHSEKNFTTKQPVGQIPTPTPSVTLASKGKSTVKNDGKVGSRYPTHKKEKFTLLEILIIVAVCVIIAILALFLRRRLNHCYKTCSRKSNSGVIQFENMSATQSKEDSKANKTFAPEDVPLLVPPSSLVEDNSNQRANGKSITKHVTIPIEPSIMSDTPVNSAEPVIANNLPPHQESTIGRASSALREVVPSDVKLGFPGNAVAALNSRSIQETKPNDGLGFSNIAESNEKDVLPPTKPPEENFRKTRKLPENQVKKEPKKMRYSELSPSLKKKVRNTFLINSIKNWKYLAHEMGYNNEEVENFEITAGSYPGETPFDFLLVDWSRQDENNVDKLLEILTRMGFTNLKMTILERF